MKKLLTIALALVLMLSLNGSALAQDAEPATATVPQATPDVTPDVDVEMEDVDEWLFDEDEWEDDEDFDLSIFDDISDDGEMLDEEDVVEDTLLSAMEVYSWFVMQPLDVDLDKPDISGTRYQVLDERFNTMSALREFVSSYFSDALVEELFAMGVYVEENGYIYTTTDGRNIDETLGETEFEVTEENTEQVIYTVVVHYWGDETDYEEEFRYVRELVDGEWKFTEFPFYW